MASVEELNKFIEGKLKLLAFISEDTRRVIEQGDVKAMERQAGSLDKTIDKLHECKLQLQEIKIEGDEDPAEVQKWKEELEAKISKYENDVKSIKGEVSGIERKEKEAIEEEKCKRLFDEELRLQEAKLQRQFEMEDKRKENSGGNPIGSTDQCRAKLPKLVMDWTGFGSGISMRPR